MCSVFDDFLLTKIRIIIDKVNIFALFALFALFVWILFNLEQAKLRRQLDVQTLLFWVAHIGLDLGGNDVINVFIIAGLHTL